MSATPFVHLHLHTQYSLLDGANRLPDVIEQAHRMGQQAIAMTDHGNMHGAIEFYLEAKKIGIKPIIGCELYVTNGSRLDRRPRAQGGAGTYHLTVLASNLTGYQNLCRLSTLAYKEGFYFKPRVDHELLTKYSEGLIVLSGCLAGELNSHIEHDDIEGGRKLLDYYARTFKDNFYLEIQPHGIKQQQKLNRGCIELAKDMGIPVVATTDCHYATKDDHYAQEVLMCVSTGMQVTDPNHLKHDGVMLHLKSGDEMVQEFGDLKYAEEAIRNTVEVAKRCELKLDFSTYHLPRYGEEKETKFVDIMAEKARSGLASRFESLGKRYADWTVAREKEYKTRLEFEIALIDKMGFSGYFLVVSDFIVWAKEHEIPVGPGRGSGAGSLVAYAMRITDIDPIHHKLLFERFLNPERVSLPDFDIDFCIYGRDRVIQYVVEKYGKEMVSQISTFGTLKAKAAIKDVGRALGISYAETDRVAQLVPAPRQGFDFSLKEALDMEPRLKEYAQGEGKELITLAMKLEGLSRHCSTHPAGVVIGDRPLIDLVPLMVDKDGNDVAQYSMTYCEKIGLVKFDFLGLKTLTVLQTALTLLKQSGIELNLQELNLDDPKTYQILCAGSTIGVFQLESGGITEMTVRLKPNCFDDLVAILALYRPGPLDSGMVDHYIARKHGKEPIAYLHPRMKNILADTYGIMIYQEQIMQLAQELAGFTLGEADLLRRAMGKKNPEEMAKQRDRFISGCAKNSIEKKLADEIFNQMETFARYGFNRSHSAAYALVSFQTGYLKAHHPVEFMAALMSHEMDDSDKTLKNLNECRKQKIKVLPPDVNESVAGFSVNAGQIRFGLEAIKGIGGKAVEAIIAAREEKPFKDLEDLVERVELRALNKRVLEGLVKSGAFDASKITRREMMDRLEDVMRAGQSLQRDKDSTQISLFGSGAQASEQKIPRRTSNQPEWPVNQRLALEREALGFYISGNPLEKFKNDLKRMGVVPLVEVRARTQPGEVRVAGVVTSLKLKNTKKGDRYASLVLEDHSATIETLVWPDTYRECANFLVADEPVIVSGKVDVSDERCTLIVQKVDTLTSLRDRSATLGVLSLTDRDNYEERLGKLHQLFQRYSGKCPVKVRVEIDGSEVSMTLKDTKNSPVTVSPSEALCDQVEQLFGRPVLSFQ